jgi:uncharacterized protein with PQ loop repeat
MHSNNNDAPLRVQRQASRRQNDCDRALSVSAITIGPWESSLSEVISTVLATVATMFTVGRTWPQFMRIVVRKDKSGVSLTTWSLALSNHTGWLVYGLFTQEPVFIISNVLAGLGCAATVWVLHSWQRMAQVCAVVAVASSVLYLGTDSLLLTCVTGFTLSVVIPQLVAVLRSPATGVSTIAWLIAACSSSTWIAWAISIDRLTVAVAHFVMLPAALVIASRAMRSHAHEETDNDVMATASSKVQGTSPCGNT